MKIFQRYDHTCTATFLWNTSQFCFDYTRNKESSQLTTDAHISHFQIHFKAGVAWVDVVERLVIDSQRALWPARAVSTDHVQHVRRTAQVSPVLQHRLEPRLNLHASTDFHPTVARTQHHDDVISGTARLESFTGAILGDFICTALYSEGRLMIMV